jgi:bifunctional DNA-binding transcriptional regulator/antitoxin component of YhaV-PrlF toxin-antitoxin module
MLVGKMEQVHLKIDSKGRLCIPQKIREKIGNTATLKQTPEGFLIVPGKPTSFQEEFRKAISSEPKRKAKPKLITPKEMKSIWKTTT